MVRLGWSIEVLTTTFLAGNCVCFLLSIIPSVAAFAETLRVRRVLPSVSPQDAYARCLRGWKRDNLGLVGVPPPILLRDGHPDTGVGMVLLRIPPFGLKEGIVGCQRDECSTTMNYQVLNPGWCTWPVAEHEGWIRFASDGERGCIMEWTVQWTPLPLPLSFWNGFLKALTTVIVETAASYVARGGSRAYQSVAIRKKE